MKKLVLTMALALIGLTAADASAQGPSPFTGQRVGPFASLFGRTPVPALQAAPWYSYWPYNSHFQTPAPMMGAFYGPGYNGGAMVNPYFLNR